MENMFFFSAIDVIISFFGFNKIKDLVKRPATDQERKMFLESYEKYDDSGERPGKRIYTYENKGFTAIADMYSTLVLKGSMVNPNPSKTLTKAWIPLVNEWCSEDAVVALAKAFHFDMAIVPDARLRAIRKSLITLNPDLNIVFGCDINKNYDIYEEDYDVLMSPNGDIIVVFDDYAIVMS